MKESSSDDTNGKRAYADFNKDLTTIIRVKLKPSCRIRLLGDRRQFQDALNIFRNQYLYYYYNRGRKEIIILPYRPPPKDKILIKICAETINERGNYKKILDKITDHLQGNILETNDNLVITDRYSRWFSLIEFPKEVTALQVRETIGSMEEVGRDRKTKFPPRVEDLKLDFLNDYKPLWGGLGVRFVPESLGGYLLIPKRILQDIIPEGREHTYFFMRAVLEERALYLQFLDGVYAEIQIYFDDKMGSFRDLINYVSNDLKINILKERKRVLIPDDISQCIIIGDLREYAVQESIIESDTKEIEENEMKEIRTRLMDDLQRSKIVKSTEKLRESGIKDDLKITFLE